MSFNSANNNGRRTSIYPDISHLNTISPEYDMSIPQSHPQSSIELDTDLSLFTDGEFFNFDMGDLNGPGPYPQQGISQPGSATQNAYANGDYHDFSMINSPHSLPGHGNMKPFAPLQSAEQSNVSTPQVGDKRKSLAGASPDAKGSPVEEGADIARVAAEEDKRRRNTAASARFRVKKKQREQAMEKTAKEMTDKVTYLENCVNQLESENKILRDLLTEKVGKDVNVAKVLADSPKNAELKTETSKIMTR